MGLIVEGIEETIDFVEDVAESAFVGAGLEIGSRLAEETPVDTGFAKNSWLATDSPDDAGEPGNNEINANRVRDFRLGETIYINNGCEYIGPLNDGHSQQAPAGMTQKVMPEVPEIVRTQIEDAERAGR